MGRLVLLCAALGLSVAIVVYAGICVLLWSIVP